MLNTECVDTDPCCRNGRIVTRRDLICRSATSECDVPEYCDGQNATCPEDLIARNGWSCSNRQAYCWNGVCQTLPDQCLKAWGSGSHGQSVQHCYTAINPIGTNFGNCGFNSSTGSYAACAAKDALCGTLFCFTDKDSTPAITASGRIRPHVISVGSARHQCRSLVITPPSSHDDPTLVKDGSLCDPSRANRDLVCHKQRCVDKTTVTKQCSLDADGKECQGTGVCTNTGYCHHTPG